MGSFFNIIKNSRAIKSFLLFLAVMGPGIITANVDNDAGGIATYSLAGAVWLYDALVAPSHHVGVDHCPGDVRPYGGGDR